MEIVLKSKIGPRSLILLSVTAFVYGGIYLGTNWISSTREFHYNLYFEWEKQVPIIPFMIIFYLSAYLLPLLPLLVLNYKKQMVVAKSIILSGLIAGIIFLAFPTQLGFHRSVENIGILRPLFLLIWSIDLPHNLVPSLHVAMSYLMIIPCLKKIGHWPRIFFLSLLVGISTSVIFVHQHHLLDLLSGLSLGIICFYVVKRYSRNKSFL